MSIAKVIEVSSQSPNSFDEAAANAIRRVSETVNNVKHAWIKDMEIEVKDDGSLVYRCQCKITFVVSGDDM